MEAIFRHGAPRMVDYTPGANVVPGQVILLGNTAGVTCGVVHTAITNATLGAIAVGDGVYEGISLENTANYAKVWWDFSAKKFTTTSTNNALFGFIVSGGAAGANTNVYALHQPHV